jgi:hypothetical protein
MKEDGRKQCIAAMEKEVVKDQSKNGNFSIDNNLTVPEGVVILLTVWQGKLRNGKRAMLNINGSRMEKGSALL